MRRLLINADDFGYDADTFAATTSLLESGDVLSATILLGYPQSDAALRYAKANGRERSFGLHFNIGEGRPLAPGDGGSLVGRDGQFRQPVAQRIQALLGGLKPDDIAREAETQLAMITDHGVAVTHVDSHGHFHKFPAVLAALRPVMRRFGIRRVRRVQSLYDGPSRVSRPLNKWCERALKPNDVTTDHFFNTQVGGDGWFDRLLERLPEGDTELGVHPGLSEPWRAAELRPLQGAARKLVDRQVALISYHDLAA